MNRDTAFRVYKYAGPALLACLVFFSAASVSDLVGWRPPASVAHAYELLFIVLSELTASALLLAVPLALAFSVESLRRYGTDPWIALPSLSLLASSVAAIIALWIDAMQYVSLALLVVFAISATFVGVIKRPNQMRKDLLIILRALGALIAANLLGGMKRRAWENLVSASRREQKDS